MINLALSLQNLESFVSECNHGKTFGLGSVCFWFNISHLDNGCNARCNYSVSKSVLRTSVCRAFPCTLGTQRVGGSEYSIMDVFGTVSKIYVSIMYYCKSVIPKSIKLLSILY